MDIDDIITKIQHSIYEGFTSTKISNLEWLNSVCGEFLNLFKGLHKFLIFDSDGNSNTIEGCFLCASQIICCIRNMELVIQIENTRTIVLTPSRQYFLDRILWCITRLKSAASTSKNVTIEHFELETNLINFMDIALDLLYPFSICKFEDETKNIAEENAEAMLESPKIRSSIDSLISHTLGFADVACDDDKITLNLQCQKVLRDCLAFQEECSIEKVNSKSNSNNRRVAADILEISLCRLETIINDCLLHLVLLVFIDIQNNPFEELENLKPTATEDEIQKETEAFDMLNDRIMQIGIFAIIFTDDIRTKSILRSSLASLESLELNLIPSIFSHCKIHSKLLKDHWLSEVKILQYHVQKIIETNAFCLSLIEILNENIRKQKDQFDINSITLCLNKAEILVKHIEINSDSLNINSDMDVKIFFDQFKLLIKECNAVIKVYGTIENDRILKRFQILFSILKKLQKALDTKNKNNTGNDKDTSKFLMDSTVEKSLATTTNETKEFFQNCGIKATTTSIFYQSKREKRNVSVSMIGNTSIIGQISSNNSFRSRKKRMSLRRAMFKKQKAIQTKELIEVAKNDSCELQLTYILDQLTDLSVTFSDESKIN